MLTKPRAISFHVHSDAKNLANRLLNPHTRMHLAKPFLSLEIVKVDGAFGESLMLPDAGTAIVILLLSGMAEFKDSTHKRAHLKENDVLWILAGSGISYSLRPRAQACVYVRLRVALSPALERAPAQSAHLGSNFVESDGPARALLGQHGDARSEWALPALTNYLVITLTAGQVWTYEPPVNHRIAWIAVIDGKIKTSNRVVSADEIAVYESSNKLINFFAEEDSIFLLGSAQEYTHELTSEKYPTPSLSESSDASKPETYESFKALAYS